MKAFLYPEYPARFHAARALGRPVKWTADRSESFLADQAGRDHNVTGELALDADGRMLAVRITGHGHMGAYVGQVSPMPASLNIVKNLTTLNRVPAMAVETRVVLNNTPTFHAQPGVGPPCADELLATLR